MYCSDGLVETLKDSSSCQNVKFYGFKKTSNKKLCANAKLLQRFVLHRSGCAYVDYLECKYLNRRSYENSLIEYNVYCNQFADVYIPCLLKARGSGIAIKNCLLCKFYKGAQLMESLCALSKKFGTPRHPKQNQAQSLQYDGILLAGRMGWFCSKEALNPVLCQVILIGCGSMTGAHH